MIAVLNLKIPPLVAQRVYYISEVEPSNATYKFENDSIFGYTKVVDINY